MVWQASVCCTLPNEGLPCSASSLQQRVLPYQRPTDTASTLALLQVTGEQCSATRPSLPLLREFKQALGEAVPVPT
ncbi:hypothetical protein E2C01_075491 [Portunus trituberculatus]|uniref:Uncharacterized protein n=1 Tax=Portunus trituberculatus TaxID=210409 RepID=A0A5B7IKA6_PORTR|nr:hypothetical protein [Portunus trituberculatus]